MAHLAFAALLLACCTLQASATPVGPQIVFDQSPSTPAEASLAGDTRAPHAPARTSKHTGYLSDRLSLPARGGFDLFHHLSSNSPYFELDATSARPPPGCKTEAAAYIIRHSSIYANDEEWPETMGPLVDKLADFDFPHGAAAPLDFLPDWQSPLSDVDEQLEALTRPGLRDAQALGHSFAHLYPHLKPQGRDRFLVWAADTPRDVGTAKAFIRGALPEHDKEGKGTGDGHVQLIKVPKKTPDWKASLTPHKLVQACPRFSKSLGVPERAAWQRVYTPAIRERFDGLVPGFNFTLEDIVGMQQLCGYETVIRGRASPLCAAFTADDILAFEYGEDLRYHYMVGYGAEFAAPLGIPFLQSAVTRLLNVSVGATAATLDEPHPHPHRPPNDTSTGQRLFTWFAHREEPPLIAVALGLFNNSEILPGNVNATMPADRIPLARLWRTSNIAPFLGHVALEKLDCSGAAYVRAIVNATPLPIPGCRGGPGDACPVDDFVDFVRRRVERYGDFEGACGIAKSTR